MKLLVLCAFIILCGCSAAVKLSPTENRGILDQLTYVRDAKTGLCFATVAHEDSASISNGFTLTWVPCEPAVLERIK